jgi:putative FmdB family regulatory protein
MGGARRDHRTAPGEEEWCMPLYEYLCPRCRKGVALTLTLKERESGGAKCPDCRTTLEPVMAPFYSKTSRKS